MWLLIAIGVLLVGIVVAAVGISLTRSNNPNTDVSSTPPVPPKEYQPPTNFKVLNYLPAHTVSISVLDSDTDENISLVKGVAPNATGGITKDKIERHLKPGNVLRIYITGSDGVTHHYADNVIDTSCYERIKNLHIGMVTTRFIGKSTDGLRMSTLADNAIQGHSWLMIHNLTELPLRLNDDITVAPHGTERYLGYLHQGVTLGTIFKDQDGLYPDFQYLNPHSDLYYGVVSDLRQPLYGPFQLEFSDECDTDQTLWPFELGQM